jgi:phosphoribosylglycinamide formyltransferase 1
MGRGGEMIIVFGSGTGSNFDHLCKAFPGKIAMMCSDNPSAPIVGLAARQSVPLCVVEFEKSIPRATWENHFLSEIQMCWRATKRTPQSVLTVMLAGFMKILSGEFLDQLKHFFPNSSVLNLHPAHLSDYKGPKAYQYAVERRFPRWGLTVHHVTEALDDGPVVASAEVQVFPWESPEQLQIRCKETERLLLEGVLHNFGYSEKRTGANE